MLDTPRSEVVWRVLATRSIRELPLHFPSRASPCAITFQLDSVSCCVHAAQKKNVRQVHKHYLSLKKRTNHQNAQINFGLINLLLYIDKTIQHNKVNVLINFVTVRTLVIKFTRTFTLLCWMVLSIYYNFRTTVWKTQELLYNLLLFNHSNMFRPLKRSHHQEVQSP